MPDGDCQPENDLLSLTTCPVPRRDSPCITMAHGGGGQLASQLLHEVFLPAFTHGELQLLGDCAILPAVRNRLAISTDSYVVRPLFFPGGSIGSLAVHGTINDLAMRGAQPLHLSVAFILEEGLLIDDLRQIVRDMAVAASQAGVAIVTGDTKVVERGHGDLCYVNTTGIGVVPDRCDIGPHRARPGDRILLSGSVGDHGMAVMGIREGLEFDPPITSDSAPLHKMVAAMHDVCPEIHVLRDPTRGGLAASLNEIATSSECGIVVDSGRVPVQAGVQAACEVLGLDPWLVANEGKLVAVVPEQYVASLVATMRSFSVGSQATEIGSVVGNHPGVVVAQTLLGTRRVVALPLGEQLPRIC